MCEGTGGRTAGWRRINGTMDEREMKVWARDAK